MFTDSITEVELNVIMLEIITFITGQAIYKTAYFNHIRPIST